jgi:D-alanyl-D-alanine dipeptidase
VTALLAAALLAASGGDLVDATRLVPDAVLDIRYATADNFLGRRLYPVARCLLRRSVAERLARAAAHLRERGYRIRLFDCYRPLSAQRELWRARPQRGFVADPRTGSHHNRGAAVDLSLLDLGGRAVEMPTPYDAFDRRARADAVRGISRAAIRHRTALRRAMEEAGFRVNRAEWWHFDAGDAHRYPLLDEPLDGGGP